MNWSWIRTKPPKETADMDRTSTGWAEEIARMIAERAATEAEAASLNTQLGSAILDAPETATGLQGQLAAAQARQTGLAAAIGQAQQRQEAAAQEEARLRLSLNARVWLATAARWLSRAADARELEAQLRALQASQAPAISADREVLDRLRSRVASLGLPALEGDMLAGSADVLRARAATLAGQAERATIEDGRIVYTGEAIDASALPPPAAKVDRVPTPLNERAQREAEQRRTDRRAVVLRGEIGNLMITNSPAEAELLASKQADLLALEQRQAELGAA